MHGIDGRTLVQALLLGALDMLLWKPLPGSAAPLGISETDSRMPTARIVVHVRQKRSKYWDFWQLNSNICPPSLCRSYDEGGEETAARRPRGTGGSIFYNGDIVLDPYSEEIIYGSDSNRRRKRATVRNRDNLWKDGIMYFQFDSSIDPLAKKAARRAMKHISDRTCIQFKKKSKDTEDYVRIISEPGCWSSVGRIGGEQKLSLGRGCERQIGTAIHEMLHTLGFWHEHARPDRDEYVQVVYPNISPRYIPDFTRINESLSKPRGFPYDYKSIMHYKDRTFTNNGGKTIRVIGVGKELKMSIGQRDGMSEIDIAQLKDLYFCNQKEDKNQTVCPRSWTKFQTSCYKFAKRPRMQFAAAQKYCQDFNGHLVSVDNQYEMNFLNKHIKQNFPRISKWRTGGRRINDTFYWDRGDSTNLRKIDFTQKWLTFAPRKYTSLVLRMNPKTKSLEFRGNWLGSAKQLPKYAFSLICERVAKRKCVKADYSDGRDYRGTLDHTRDGVTCQNWTSQYPHNHTIILPGAKYEDKDGIGPNNYCRNPSALRRNRPWCYTTKRKQEWQYCDVNICAGTLKFKVKQTVNNVIPPSKPKLDTSENTVDTNMDNNIPETIFRDKNPSNNDVGNDDVTTDTELTEDNHDYDTDKPRRKRPGRKGKGGNSSEEKRNSSEEKRHSSEEEMQSDEARKDRQNNRRHKQKNRRNENRLPRQRKG